MTAPRCGHKDSNGKQCRKMLVASELWINPRWVDAGDDVADRSFYCPAHDGRGPNAVYDTTTHQWVEIPYSKHESL